MFKRQKTAVLVLSGGEEYILDPGRTNTIGRGHSEDISIEDDLRISRRHSVIIYDKQTKAYYIEDIGSRHGTLVNGEKIIGKKELKPGDVIKIGEYTKFTFEVR